jgi:hypothetical protein
VVCDAADDDVLDELLLPHAVVSNASAAIGTASDFRIEDLLTRSLCRRV